ncbi:MAG: hypothetical protein HQ580_01890 [Planctomycetes bacterium]|nr:hypothetical protein [Planctomycetota bacterium]
MYSIQKLKPDRNFYGLLLPFAVLTIGALFGFLFGLEAAFYFIAVFFSIYALYSFLTFVRTRNPGFIVVGFYQISLVAMAFLMPERIGGPRDPEIIFLMFLILFFLVWTIILFVTKKMKWRGREILEMVAGPVDDTGSGYTTRPMPAGKTEFTQRQIIQFSKFAMRHLIAVPYIGKDKVVFVPVMAGREFSFILGLKNDYTDETWVAFDFNGDVSVNISHRDYLNYNEELSFDQLCESLGNVFIGFMEIFQRREGTRIIDRMNTVGISPFS